MLLLRVYPQMQIFSSEPASRGSWPVMHSNVPLFLMHRFWATVASPALNFSYGCAVVWGCMGASGGYVKWGLTHLAHLLSTTLPELFAPAWRCIYLIYTVSLWALIAWASGTVFSMKCLQGWERTGEKNVWDEAATSSRKLRIGCLL